MYKRILLKLSGEALAGNERNFDPVCLRTIAEEIKQVHDLGIEVSIVVGGGNFIRGKALVEMGIDRVQGDSMGMLATIINALAVQVAEAEGSFCRKPATDSGAGGKGGHTDKRVFLLPQLTGGHFADPAPVGGIKTLLQTVTVAGGDGIAQVGLEIQGNMKFRFLPLLKEGFLQMEGVIVFPEEDVHKEDMLCRNVLFQQKLSCKAHMIL